MKIFQKGISLIVLVITIIVLAILATTTIITLSSSNLIGKAQDAVDAANAKQIEEMMQIAMSSYIIDVGSSSSKPTTVSAAIAKLNEFMPEEMQITVSSSDGSKVLGDEDTQVTGTVGDYNIDLSLNDSGDISCTEVSKVSTVAKQMQVGDYVNYVAPTVNYTVLGTDSGMYQFLNSYKDTVTDESGSPVTVDLSAISYVDSSTGNQTFTSYSGRWQVLSINNGTVMLINESSLGSLSYNTVKNLNTILSNICNQYMDPDIVASARSINYADFVDGVMSTIPTSSTVRVPGYTYCLGTESIYDMSVASATGGLWYEIESEVGTLQEDNDTNEYSQNAPAFWFSYYDYGNLIGPSTTGHMTSARAGDGVRAIITLKSDLTFTEQSSLVNGKTMWDIN